MDSEQVAAELEQIKKELKVLGERNHEPVHEEGTAMFMRYLAERDQTNRVLAEITQQIRKLEEVVNSMAVEPTPDEFALASSKEIGLGDVDAKVMNYIQTKGMVCAEEVQTFMGYKGKNAACARLNMLFKQGLLNRFQLGHKVYFRYDAGKANQSPILIVSPPQ